MIRLFKLCFGLAAFCAFAWFGTTVQLGDRTLFGHLRAIAQTKESQELVDGTKRAAEPLVDGVKRRVTGAPPVAAAAPDAGAAPQERVSAADRRQLRRIISSARP
jgi:hypothetical protein